ncbi:MAG: hypothetical protein AB2L14_05905 [Candidatus Xenobiia bacterium LiM19]
MKYIFSIMIMLVLLVSAVLLSSVLAGNTGAAWVLEVKGSATGQNNQQNFDIKGGMSLENGTKIKAGSSATVRILIREQGIFTIKDGESYTVSADSRTAGSLGKSFGNLMEMLAGKLQNNSKGLGLKGPTGGGTDEGKNVRIFPVFTGSTGPMLPMEGDLLCQEVTFQWGGKDHPEKYTFVLSHSDEKKDTLQEIYRARKYSPGEMTWKSYSDNTTVCRFIYTGSEKNLEYDGYYQWGVSKTPDGQPDSYTWFHIVPYNEEKLIQQKFGEMRADLGLSEGSRSITYSLLCGALYEQKKLYTDAWQAYQSAIDAVEPGDDKVPYEMILKNLSDKIRQNKTKRQNLTGVQIEHAIRVTAQ